MALSKCHIIIISLLSIFICLIILLFIFCIYSSRKAHKDLIISQNSVLGKWKDNRISNSNILSLDSTKKKHSNLNECYRNISLKQIDVNDDIDKISIKTEKRGSGLAGIGTFSATTHKISSSGIPFPQHQNIKIPASNNIYDFKPDVLPKARPLSWSKGLPNLTRTRTRSKSNTSEKSKSSYKFTKYKMNKAPELPHIPRKNSARSLASQGCRDESLRRIILEYGENRDLRKDSISKR
ncbi:uncharacterized protein I206_105057 [Kwoniella pini CBS 10737]|uniref:Uncharacterized protein n=1 Tax=Kwoniella pini CBS 10737 TaxID=1296096 RepID=A0A1B9I8Z6_9TREE|nr:uncharacterized protein I206_02597 [Kwoniella pini CBS 10737]OCF51881.1 hypothetical protein I206_02597 [Kwoniella pini CBS 10737]